MEKFGPVGMAAIMVAVVAAIATIGAAVVSVPAPVQGVTAELSGQLTIAGSTTVLPINQECARLLMKKNPGLRISVSGGGSGPVSYTHLTLPTKA